MNQSEHAAAGKLNGGAGDAIQAAKTGGGEPAQKAVHSPEEMERRSQASREQAASLGQIVSLMMRSRGHRHNLLAELEWQVVPAITSRQFRVAEGVSAEAGIVAPIAAVLWASVSDEVDRRLTEGIDTVVRLKPQEWTSGSHVWIVEALGEPKAVQALLQHLKQNELSSAGVKMRVRGQDGKAAVGRVEIQVQPKSQAGGQASRGGG